MNQGRNRVEKRDQVVPGKFAPANLHPLERIQQLKRKRFQENSLERINIRPSESRRSSESTACPSESNRNRFAGANHHSLQRKCVKSVFRICFSVSKKKIILFPKAIINQESKVNAREIDSETKSEIKKGLNQDSKPQNQERSQFTAIALYLRRGDVKIQHKESCGSAFFCGFVISSYPQLFPFMGRQHNRVFECKSMFFNNVKDGWRLLTFSL